MTEAKDFNASDEYSSIPAEEKTANDQIREQERDRKPTEPKPAPDYGDKMPRARSWMCVINNPEKIFPNRTPDQIVDLVGKRFAGKNRGCMVNFERGHQGTNHCHVLVEDTNPIRASTLDRLFPVKDEKGKQVKDAEGNKLYWLFNHDFTLGNIIDIENYMNKRGTAANDAKADTLVVAPREYGVLKTIGHVRTGKKQQDLNIVKAYLDRGLKPRDIYQMDQNYRYLTQQIEAMANEIIEEEQPTRWDMAVHWCIGASGTRKSSYLETVEEQFGRKEVFMVSQYKNWADSYKGQKVVFFDEFRGEAVKGNTPQISWELFLTLTSGIRGDVAARYNNHAKQWTDVFVTSVLMPEEAFPDQMDSVDTIGQLKRRISDYIYFFRTKDGEYRRKVFPSFETISKEYMQERILEEFPDAVFEMFTQDTWEEYEAINGTRMSDMAAENAKRKERKITEEQLLDFASLFYGGDVDLARERMEEDEDLPY